MSRVGALANTLSRHAFQTTAQALRQGYALAMWIPGVAPLVSVCPARGLTPGLGARRASWSLPSPASVPGTSLPAWAGTLGLGTGHKTLSGGKSPSWATSLMAPMFLISLLEAPNLHPTAPEIGLPLLGPGGATSPAHRPHLSVYFSRDSPDLFIRN